jgi:hypothetical protein
VGGFAVVGKGGRRRGRSHGGGHGVWGRLFGSITGADGLRSCEQAHNKKNSQKYSL